jgi:hypothetical protein
LATDLADVSSSAADATVCKPVLASSAAAVTAAACRLLRLAESVIDCAVASNPVEDEVSIPTKRPTLLSKLFAIWFSAPFDWLPPEL